MKKKDINLEIGDFNSAIHRWYRLQDDGRIEQIEIHTYNFPSNFHFMVVDYDSAQFGLLRHGYKYPIVVTLNTFILNNESSGGSKLIEDYTILFENIFKNYSEPFIESN